MEGLVLELENSAIDTQKQAEYLHHACECRDADCRLPSCQKMKRRVQHLKSCRQRFNRACPSCRQIISLCIEHAEGCQKAKCSVPFCITIKLKLWTNQRRWFMQQARILDSRIVAMQNNGTLQPSPGNLDPSSQRKVRLRARNLKKILAAMQNQVVQPNLVNSSSAIQPSLCFQPHSSLYRPQLDTTIKPVDVLQSIQLVRAKYHKLRFVQNLCDNLQLVLNANFGENYLVGDPSVANIGLMASNQQIQSAVQEPMSQMPGFPNSVLDVGNVASMGNSEYAEHQQSHENTQPLPMLKSCSKFHALE